MKYGLSLLVIGLFILSMYSCGSNDDGILDGDTDNGSDGDFVEETESDNDPAEDGDIEAAELEQAEEETRDPNVPEDVPELINILPFEFERENSGDALSENEINEFTNRFTSFFKNSDYFNWMSRYHQGLPDDNQLGQPGYKVWWTNTYASKKDGLVTITWETPSDNSTAKVTRALAPTIALLLNKTDYQVAYDLALGYIRGLSATYDGMIWKNEDPIVDTIMARCIFQKSYETTLDGGRKIAVDYDSVRYEIEERRHDTVHNPENPAYGDIYVRNKRSKDDFPYLYRDMFWLIRLIWQTEDDTLRDAAIKLFRQIRKMAKDIVDHDYCIRTKDKTGTPFVPKTESGGIEDFATFAGYDVLFPNAECNAKLTTAYLAEGKSLGNDCIIEDVDFYGHGGLYEDISISGNFWTTNMIWGYHVTALAISLAFGDKEIAEKEMEGLAARLTMLMSDERQTKFTEWMTDVAQLLVQASAYGVPLTNDEAKLIQQKYDEAFTHYNNTVQYDIWDKSVPDDVSYPVLPDRNEYDNENNVIKTHVRPTEILNPFEYCASPIRATKGAQFIDCEKVLDPEKW